MTYPSQWQPFCNQICNQISAMLITIADNEFTALVGSLAQTP